jgi:ribosomal protein S18 acetylase RimI-like enzyme
VTVRQALRADLPELSHALAEAFVDDPMMVWIAGGRDADARRAIFAPGFFLPCLAAGLGRGHTYTTSDRTGAAIWSPPETHFFDEAHGAAFGEAVKGHAGTEAVMRLVSLGAMVGGHHPYDIPHFYLFVLGTTTKGHGIGSDLLRPVLDRCDADGLPAYLESSNSRNVGFYERHGFQVQWEERPSDDGPLLRGMWRVPVR